MFISVGSTGERSTASAAVFLAVCLFPGDVVECQREEGDVRPRPMLATEYHPSGFDGQGHDGGLPPNDDDAPRLTSPLPSGSAPRRAEPGLYA